jgi:hypothetical protein
MLFGSFFRNVSHSGAIQRQILPLPRFQLPYFRDEITKFENEAMKHANVNTSAYPILTERELFAAIRLYLLMVSELHRVFLQCKTMFNDIFNAGAMLLRYLSLFKIEGCSCACCPSSNDFLCPVSVVHLQHRIQKIQTISQLIVSY